ncbi:heme-binding protein [Crenobacter sp. SG2303]|uniref:Heme-binding protein n=1 Tax=Crenobacter oryzisoli TaxID=3056844 RepID=A0ABT7XNA1_9NEIS|nr:MULTISPECIES: heme-binding protein [unclassified Crenobacter]MDN0075269.1 heme-binding protein [Crenobacter sp. SG2303]MDN0082859.1 heme-binding protein [Crenobacter sp. SG2305]
MQHKAVLTLVEVEQLLQAARAEAAANNWNISVAVVDDGGHPLGLSRMDNCAPLSAHIATEKARSAALGRRESKAFEDMINSGRTAFLSAPVLHAMLEGGVPVLVDGQVVGAVGISGLTPELDARIAKVAIASLAL